MIPESRPTRVSEWMATEQIDLENGGTISVHFERDEPVCLAVSADESESGTTVVCSSADVDRIFALLVVARRGSWGYS